MPSSSLGSRLLAQPLHAGHNRYHLQDRDKRLRVGCSHGRSRRPGRPCLLHVRRLRKVLRTPSLHKEHAGLSVARPNWAGIGQGDDCRRSADKPASKSRPGGPGPLQGGRRLLMLRCGIPPGRLLAVGKAITVFRIVVCSTAGRAFLETHGPADRLTPGTTWCERFCRPLHRQPRIPLFSAPPSTVPTSAGASLGRKIGRRLRDRRASGTPCRALMHGRARSAREQSCSGHDLSTAPEAD